MGTLTAGQPRLDGYCDHKLPTSCRLTSIPECCACADERAHSAAYSTYIDGVGYVQRGVRWQRYCWFCKEFWAERVRVSGLRPGQTKVPEAPDQTEFLERWYEFHRGYRTVTRENGSEERVAVLGEELREVDPGCLPRTLEEMRAGRAADDATARARQQQQVDAEVQEETGPSLEDTLDQLLLSVSNEDDGQQQTLPLIVHSTPFTRAPENQEHQTRDMLREDRESSNSNAFAQVMMPPSSRNREYQARRIAALRRELHRMRSGIERVISGLRDLGEAVPDHGDATGRLTDLGRTLEAIDGVQSDDTPVTGNVNEASNATNASQNDRTLASIEERLEEARTHINEARRNRDQAATELDLADQEYRTSQHRVQQLQREQRTTENYLRLFGTREEMLAQGENYESPIGGMFNRAYERFRVAEDVRQEERTLVRVLADEERAGGEEAARQHLAQEHQEATHFALGRLGNRERRAAFDNAALPGGYDPLAAPSENFPRNMLNHLVAARGVSTSEAAHPVILPTQDTTHVADTDWVADIDHILQHLAYTSNDALDAEEQVSQNDIRLVRFQLGQGTLTDEYRQGLDALLTAPETVWGSGLPAARLARSRMAGLTPSLVTSNDARTYRERTTNIELMGEMFQMSAEVRRAAPDLSAPEQLRMLYRLQSGQRTVADVAKLEEMQDTLATVILAGRIFDTRNTAEPETLTSLTRRRLLDQQRRAAARQGDRSRDELDAQRRATHAFAVASGATAMRTRPAANPSVLLERLAQADQDTRAAYDQLRANGYSLAEDSAAIHDMLDRPPEFVSEDEDEDEDEDQGLDDKKSGRPEPRAEEDLTVTMECRICYTQLAEIACLPCGHLVMCKWCSEMHSPVMAHDRTRPRRAAGCPVCRKAIRQKVRVFRA